MMSPIPASEFAEMAPTWAISFAVGARPEGQEEGNQQRERADEDVDHRDLAILDVTHYPNAVKEQDGADIEQSQSQ